MAPWEDFEYGRTGVAREKRKLFIPRGVDPRVGAVECPPRSRRAVPAARPGRGPVRDDGREAGADGAAAH